MAEALKDMFNKKFYERLAIEFYKADKNFHSEKFVKDVIKDLDKLEFNERLRNTTLTLKKYLPSDYKKSVDIIKQVAPDFSKHYTAFIFPDFVGQYGHDNIDLSLETLKYLTQYGTSEFAIREFLKRDFNGTLKVMQKWAEDENYHVRRLSSEGCRPRLPWSYNLPEVMKNPELTLPILEKLKADNELYVKKSVANHLNDFSRNHTDWMVNLLRSWDKSNVHTAWIIKHASRTLIKKGHADTLAIFGFEKNPKILIGNLKLKKTKIKLGDSLDFSFEIVSERSGSQKLVIDYAIYYEKRSGLQSRKIFKLKELVLAPETIVAINKAQSFKDFSTRKHCSGKHKIEILINGKVHVEKEFFLSI